MKAIGSFSPLFILYVPRTVPYPGLQDMNRHRLAKPGELIDVMHSCSNDWRKIFSTFSKIIVQTLKLNLKWQDYRDEFLCQKNGNECIVFEPAYYDKYINQSIHIIASQKLYDSFDKKLPNKEPVGNFQKIWHEDNHYLTPYFDYRQFPNLLIETFVKHLQERPFVQSYTLSSK